MDGQTNINTYEGGARLKCYPIIILLALKDSLIRISKCFNVYYEVVSDAQSVSHTEAPIMVAKLNCKCMQQKLKGLLMYLVST